MNVEIIAIGTEITTGQNLDTNSQWLSQRLFEAGVTVRFHTTMSDTLADQVSALRIACSRADIVIVTGGLGPTLDDLTREALAQVMGVELMFDSASFETIQAMFTQRHRVMPACNRVQAYLPSGAEFIPNSLGTAPGMWAQVGSARIACLPGVPSELKPMFLSWVMPRLGLGARRQWIRRVHAFGAGESAIDERLQGLTARGREPEVGITASGGVITLRIAVKAANEAAAQAAIAPVEKQIRERLGDLVFGVDDEELPDAVARLLIEQNQTIATAESVTAGQVAQLLARTPGASTWLRGGVVAYVNDAKMKLLGVPESILRENGAVSAEVAVAMAEGARCSFETDLAISTTGLAGPSDGGEGKPVGLCFIGLAWNGGNIARQVNWFGTRVEVQARTAHSALDFARLRLQGRLGS